MLGDGDTPKSSIGIEIMLWFGGGALAVLAIMAFYEIGPAISDIFPDADRGTLAMLSLLAFGAIMVPAGIFIGLASLHRKLSRLAATPTAKTTPREEPILDLRDAVD